MMRFVSRERCEVCGCEHGHTLTESAFSAPDINGFLDEYYGGRVDTASLAEGRYTIRQCADCGFVWQRDILNESGMQQLYDEWISPEESLRKHQTKQAETMRSIGFQMAMIAALLREAPKPLNVLDYGAGWGAWSHAAKQYGYDVNALEFSASRRQHLQSLNLPVISDVNALNSPVHFVNFEQVMEHVPDPAGVLQSLVPHLASCTIIRISVPDGKKTLAALRAGKHRIGKDALHPLEHINCFTHKTISQCAERNGFSVIPVGRLLVASVRAFLSYPHLAPALRVTGAHIMSTSRYFMLRKVVV